MTHNRFNISNFNVSNNNEIFNPLVERLIDMDISLYRCNCIDYTKDDLRMLRRSKYYRTIKRWNRNNTHMAYNNDQIVHNRYKNDNNIASKLNIIFDISYLTELYPDVNISQFNYLNQ